MSAQVQADNKGQGGGGPQIEINGAFQAFKIEPKDDAEVKQQEQGMPKDCAYAMAAMLHNSHVEVAKRCNQCLSETMEILAAGPDGQSKLNIGQAIICWDCGNVGIPNNHDELLKAVTGSDAAKDTFAPDSMISKMPPFAKCDNCGKDRTTNWVIPRQPDGSVLPWIQRARITAPEPSK